MVGGGVPAMAAPRSEAVGGGLAYYSSQWALRRRSALPPPRGPSAGPAVPARPGEHGGIAPPGLEECSEGFVSAVQFPAVRSEQHGPPAVERLRGAGDHISAWSWGGRDSGIGTAASAGETRLSFRAQSCPATTTSLWNLPGTCSHCERSCSSEMLYYCRTCLWER